MSNREYCIYGLGLFLGIALILNIIDIVNGNNIYLHGFVVCQIILLFCIIGKICGKEE